jgi:hypothetical protein
MICGLIYILKPFFNLNISNATLLLDFIDFVVINPQVAIAKEEIFNDRND